VFVRHAVSNRARALRRRREENLRPELETALISKELDPSAAYERGRVLDLLGKALADLEGRVEERNYQALYLRWIEGLSVSEVAARLDRTPQQVRDSCDRMREILRRILEIHGKAGLLDVF
jgi:RNA polymerase sigma factor (sigma-70 family)